MRAHDLREAYIVLRQQEWIVFELKEVKKSIADRIAERIDKWKLGEKWTALFFRQLSTTLDVMNLHDAMTLLLKAATDPLQQQILNKMLIEIKIGRTLADAMEPYKLIFPHNVVQMIVIAQRSGRMQEITGKLAEQLERSYKAKQKLRSALYYPAFVFVVAMISVAILINVVLPTFAGFFANQEAKLPMLTQIFLRAGLFIANNLFIMFAVVALLISAFVWIYKNSPRFKMFVDQNSLKIPFYGSLKSRHEWMNSFGALAFLLESGVQINTALEMVAKSTSNAYFRKFWLEAKRRIEFGENMSRATFPTEYQGLIVTGENSGTLVEMLKRCEKLSEFEVEELSGQIPVKAEIFSTLLIGLIVALIVFSVVLPILSIEI